MYFLPLAWIGKSMDSSSEYGPNPALVAARTFAMKTSISLYLWLTVSSLNPFPWMLIEASLCNQAPHLVSQSLT